MTVIVTLLRPFGEATALWPRSGLTAAASAKAARPRTMSLVGVVMPAIVPSENTQATVNARSPAIRTGGLHSRVATRVGRLFHAGVTSMRNRPSAVTLLTMSAMLAVASPAAACLAQVASRATAPDSSWVSRSAIYEVFVRDFSPSGDFRGVTAGWTGFRRSEPTSCGSCRSIPLE